MLCIEELRLSLTKKPFQNPKQDKEYMHNAQLGVSQIVAHNYLNKTYRSRTLRWINPATDQQCQSVRPQQDQFHIQNVRPVTGGGNALRLLGCTAALTGKTQHTRASARRKVWFSRCLPSDICDVCEPKALKKPAFLPQFCGLGALKPPNCAQYGLWTEEENCRFKKNW